jgi:hypothetical protein
LIWSLDFVRDVGGAVKGVKFDKMASLVWSTIKGVRDSLVHIATLVTKIVLGSVNIADNTLTAAEQTIRSSAELTDIQNKTTALQRTSDRLVRDGHQALTLSQQMGYWFTKATDALSKAPLAFIRNTLPNSLNLIWKMTSRMWTRLMVNFRDSGTSIFRFLYESTLSYGKGLVVLGVSFELDGLLFRSLVRSSGRRTTRYGTRLVNGRWSNVLTRSSRASTNPAKRCKSWMTTTDG